LSPKETFRDGALNNCVDGWEPHDSRENGMQPAFDEAVPQMCANPEVGFRRDREMRSIMGWLGEPGSEEALDPVFFPKASEDSNLNTNDLALPHIRAPNGNECNAIWLPK
jgi:hypothetical protein